MRRRWQAAAEPRLGGDPEVFGRPKWAQVREAYLLHDMATIGMQPVFLCDAVRDREVEVDGLSPDTAAQRLPEEITAR